ncbi:hypothetical protein PoB_004928700 [Plakobranchus ocellatus]|uniref:Uncharacterized protein n=1 Tax=Plakobranchus ocellatus TaxID=259542 RepID=A0AAV4BTW8_9GAST|nr:hypothetical protein PoB_004928700 [Plakobranchus ocellatus]
MKRTSAQFRHRVKITNPLLDGEIICTISPESRLQTLCWMERTSAQFLQSQDYKPCLGWREHLHSFSIVKITNPLLDGEKICTVLQSEDYKSSVG